MSKESEKVRKDPALGKMGRNMWVRGNRVLGGAKGPSLVLTVTVMKACGQMTSGKDQEL